MKQEPFAKLYICQILGGKPLDVMQMTALHEYVLDQGNKKKPKNVTYIR